MLNIIYERLDKSKHDRSNFDCGEETLNNYLLQQASQNQLKSGSVTHVAVELDAGPLKRIYGYYTLVNHCIPFQNIPDRLGKGLPKEYPVPTIKIAKLARDTNYTPKGFGEYLLIDALKRIALLSNETGIYAIDVDLINDGAKKFYKKYEFVAFNDADRTMFMTMKTAKQLIVNPFE